MAKILISDPVSAECIELLDKAGFDLDIKTDKKNP